LGPGGRRFESSHSDHVIPLQIPLNTELLDLSQTLLKLKKVGNILRRLDLLNSKYLYQEKKSKIYYFSLRIKHQTFRKSLKTNNYIYANILKYKILNGVQKMDKDDLLNLNNGYTIIKTGNGFVYEAENETEKKLIDDNLKALNSKMKRLSKKYNEIKLPNDENGKESRNRTSLKKCCDSHLDFIKSSDIDSRTISKYNQAIELLYIFFGEKKLITSISSADATDFQEFLLKIPQNYKNIKSLQGKNIKLLIEKKSKLIENLPTLKKSTIEQILNKVRAIFNRLVKKETIIKSPFNNIDKLHSRKEKSEWKEFTPKILNNLFKNFEEENKISLFNFCKILLHTGYRRNELIYLKVKEVNLDLDFFDNHESGTKTENATRIIPIHKNIKNLVLELVKNKDDEDYLFNFDDLQIFGKKWKNEKIAHNVGIKINESIKKIVDEDKKKHYNIHSFRKNFLQEIFLQSDLEGLELDSIAGHSTDSNITDKHYLFGKRNYKKIKEKIDIVDFSHYFKYQKEKIKINSSDTFI